jgi:hypothetical protein
MFFMYKTDNILLPTLGRETIEVSRSTLDIHFYTDEMFFSDLLPKICQEFLLIIELFNSFPDAIF